MDLIIKPAEQYVLGPYVYPEWLPEDDIRRQALTSILVLTVGGALLYFITAPLSYVFLFDKSIRYHPRFRPNQEWMEIVTAVKAMPLMGVYTMPLVVAELRGYSKLFDDFGSKSLAWHAGSVLLFLFWNDVLVYWIHRGLHEVPFLYKTLHKDHHKPVVPSPFAALCFHPLDGVLQSLPYHLFVFVFPFHKVVYLVSFVMVQLWTISIHDHYFVVPEFLDPYINGAAHHSAHHLYFSVNHGLYTTLMDRLFGTHRLPDYEPVTTIERMKREGKIPVDGAVVKKVE